MANVDHSGESSRDGPDLGSVLYQELHVLAERALRRERADHTLQPTALLHEAWIRLERQEKQITERAAFFATAAKMIRRVLVDHARARARLKRRGLVIPLNEELPASDGVEDAEILSLHEALDKMPGIDARMAQIVALRFFGGLTMEETARHLCMPLITVRRTWAFARSWLRRELRRDEESDA